MFRTLAKMPFLSQLRLSPSMEETEDQGDAAGSDYDDWWWFVVDHDFVILMMTIFTSKGARQVTMMQIIVWMTIVILVDLLHIFLKESKKNIAYLYELSWIELLLANI